MFFCKFIFTNSKPSIMKRTLFFLVMLFLMATRASSQCVPTCSSYAVMPVTFTTLPSAGNNAIPLFSPNTDDGHTPPVPIGFSFNFYCITYTSVLIYTNGLIQFDIGAPSTFPAGYDPAQLLPNSTVPNGMVCFRMDDLDPTVGGTVTYTTLGTSPNQMFVVTYSNVPIYGQSSLLQSGQIVLYETSNIIDIYSISAPASPNLSTQGIENATGTNGVAPAGLNQAYWSLSNTGYRFLPFTPGPPAALTGNTLACQGEPLSYLASSIAGVSYNWYLPPGWLGTSTLSAINATAMASGVVSVSATYTCGTSVPTVLNVSVVPSPTVVAGQVSPAIICSGKTISITPSGAASYTVNPGSMTGASTLTDMPQSSTVYTVTGTNSLGCVSFNTATTSVLVMQSPTLAMNSGSICLGEAFTFTPQGAVQYSITGGFFTVYPQTAAQHVYTLAGAAGGCQALPITATVTVFGLPTITAVPSRSAICRKESTIITATGAVTYTWSNASTNHTLSVAPLTTTFYVVTGTGANGCANTATASLIVNPCTGIAELPDSKVETELYPNPTSGTFEVRCQNISDKAQVEVYNALGQLIVTAKAEQSVMFDLKGQSNGIYYVKIREGDKSEVLKLIKQ